LVFTYLARAGMDGKTNRVAVTERVDLRLVLRVANERIVLWHGAVVVQSQHLAGVAVWFLRTDDAASAAPAASRHEQRAVAAKCDARGATCVRTGHEDLL